MADNEKTVSKKKSGQSFSDKVSAWFKGLKSEFNKIIWENRETVFKQTVSVVSISVILGIIIAIIDYILKYGIDFITKL